MKMIEVQVYEEGGHVIICQYGPFNEVYVVELSPEQVPLVIKWMREAASEARKGE